MANECGLTVSMIDSGLDALKKANISQKGLYYQAFFSLSIGIERLLKISLISEYRVENEGEFPNNNKMKKYGHDLNKLLKSLNIKFENNIDLSIVSLLNDFAKSSRYYNVDVMVNGLPRINDPLVEWNSIRNQIIECYDSQIERDENKYQLAALLDSNSIFIHHDLTGRLLDGAYDVLSEYEIKEMVQNYSVQHVFGIIIIIVDNLMEIRGKRYLLPDLIDFFGKYNSNIPKEEIRDEIDWLDFR